MLVKPQVSYPGIYVQEVNPTPTGIADVPTSVTAFVGRTLLGPVNNPLMVMSMADFQRQFGGSWPYSPLSYAVQDFFNNGGTQALIVRAHSMPDPNDKKATPVWVLADPSDAKKGDGFATIAVTGGKPQELPDSTPPPAGPPPPASPPPATSGGGGAKAVLTLKAASPGTWGNYLYVRFDLQGITDSSAIALGFKPGELFNISITYNPPSGNKQSERFTNVSVRQDAGNRRLDRVLALGSSLVTFPWPGNVNNAQLVTDVKNMVAQFDQERADPDWKLKLPTGTGGSDGQYLMEAEDYAGAANQAAQTGIYALEKADIFNLLCIPRDQWGTDNNVDFSEIMAYCVKKRAFWIMDPPAAGAWDKTIVQGGDPSSLITTYVSGLTTDYRNGAVYYPDVFAVDPNTGQILTNPMTGEKQYVGPCGMVAGIYARTDSTRGIWKAPAGRTDGAMGGVIAPTALLNNDHNGAANLAGVNCLRTFPIVGTVVWGARTLYGAEALEDAYKYVPVRRLTMYIEESLYRGLQWAVFEPNAEPLWSAIRLSVTTFLNGLMKQGAFQGQSQKEAFFVQCDASTTSPDDIAKGVCNVIVGIAPVKPAEFIILYIQQMTAGSQPS